MRSTGSTTSKRLQLLETNPLTASITPRYTNKYSYHKGLTEDELEEAVKQEEEEEEAIAKAPVSVISGYTGMIPGIKSAMYGRNYPRAVKDGPKFIMPQFATPEEPLVPPDDYYPTGCQTMYARKKKNLRNRGHFRFGDDRLDNLHTTYIEFFADLRGDKPKSQMMVHLESLPKDRLDQLYKNAEKKIGKQTLDKWETAMRDKVNMYTTGGPGAIRRAFKYFDRDASGSVDFDEFKYALDTFGMNLTEDQLLAFFGRYDEKRTTEIGYKLFIDTLLDEGSMYKDVQANMAANLAAAVFGADEDAEPREELTEEEKAAQKPMIEKMFHELDADGSGLLDHGEIKQLCNDLGLQLTDEQVDMALAKIDEDNSGECDFEEFFNWYIKM